MPIRLTLICHGATDATRRAAFPRDEPLEAKAATLAAGLGLARSANTQVFVSPALRARETAEAMGLVAIPEPALRDLDHGRWAGSTLAEIEAEEPAALALWLADPESAPHGGESIAELLARAGAWLGGLDALGDGPVLAITHAAVIRAAILHALGAPASGFWRIDVAPLSRTELHGRAGAWTLRSLAWRERHQSG